MDTKMELEDLMRRERRYWLRIDELVDKIYVDKNCPELGEDFRRLKFLLRKVKNTDDYEFHFNELCIENNQGNVQKLKTENTQKEAPETNAQASTCTINLTSATALSSPTNTTVQSRSASAEKTTPELIEKTAKKKKKYVRDFSSSDSESEVKIMPKPKRIKKDEVKRGRPKKKKAEYPRTTVGKFTSIPPLEDIPNSHENENTKQSPTVSPQRKISLKRLAKSTPEAEKEQPQINQSIYEIAKEFLSSQSPTSETVKRKRGRPKGRKNTPKSDAPKSKTPKTTPKSKRLANLQLENEKEELQNEKEELSDDDKPIVDIITKEFEDDLQNQVSE